jgi:plastocyanin
MNGLYRFIALIGLFAAVSTMGTGCPATTPSIGDPDAVVNMENISFNPDSVTIEVGQTVRWVNNDNVEHTVTSGNPGETTAGSQFDSGNIAPGGVFEQTFTQAGTFEYFCEIHPTLMSNATVLVQ